MVISMKVIGIIILQWAKVNCGKTMAISTRVILKTIKQTVKVPTSIMEAEDVIQASGKMIYKKVMVKKLGPMANVMKAISMKELKSPKESKYGQMGPIMMVNGKPIR